MNLSGVVHIRNVTEDLVIDNLGGFTVGYRIVPGNDFGWAIIISSAACSNKDNYSRSFGRDLVQKRIEDNIHHANGTHSNDKHYFTDSLNTFASRIGVELQEENIFLQDGRVLIHEEKTNFHHAFVNVFINGSLSGGFVTKLRSHFVFVGL